MKFENLKILRCDKIDVNVANCNKQNRQFQKDLNNIV